MNSNWSKPPSTENRNEGATRFKPAATQQPQTRSSKVLRPGDFYFGTQGEDLRTLLGSCVAITLWHPGRLMGGMCHYLLPAAPASQSQLDGRYADHAVKLFLRELQRYRLKPEDFEVKIFGGGNMFPNIVASNHRNGGTNSVGEMNVVAADRLLTDAGFKISKRHVGLNGHRTVRLDLATGDTWIRWQGD